MNETTNEHISHLAKEIGFAEQAVIDAKENVEIAEMALASAKGRLAGLKQAVEILKNGGQS